MLKMMCLLLAGIWLCVLVIIFIILPSIFLLIESSKAINKGIIPNSPTIVAAIRMLIFTLPFPMTILVQKLWILLEPFFDKFDKI